MCMKNYVTSVQAVVTFLLLIYLTSTSSIRETVHSNSILLVRQYDPVNESTGSQQNHEKFFSSRTE